jgi:serine/threonine-protein kinase RIO1
MSGHRAAYIDKDPRYRALQFNKQTNRKMFSLWAEKERRNLVRARRAGEPHLQ